MRACRYLKRRLCHRRVQEEEAEEEERELRLRLMRRRFGRRYRDLEGFEVLSPLEYSFFEEQQQRVLFFNFSKKKRKKKKKNFWGQSPKPKGFLNFFPFLKMSGKIRKKVTVQYIRLLCQAHWAWASPMHFRSSNFQPMFIKT